MTKQVREFSAVGPCIVLGSLAKRTAKSVAFVDRHGQLGRRSGERVSNGIVHTEACPSCRDHQHSQYPNGYEN